jgi:hypothetical protein
MAITFAPIIWFYLHQASIFLCTVSGPRSGVYKKFRLQGYNAVYFAEILPIISEEHIDFIFPVED